MKITHNINISGIVFQMDEDAYQALNNYLDKLRKHFTPSEDTEEIIQDIESRIAELLSQRISDHKQVINMEDVSWIIKTLGQPDEFEGSEGSPGTFPAAEPGEKRFFRDPDGRFIGGICAGIAAYFNIDPLWIRIIFLLSIFAGGFGVVIYLILWAVIPEARNSAEKLAMRGRKVTISSIEKSIMEEVGMLKGKFGKISEHQSQVVKGVSSATRSIVDGLIRIAYGILKFTLKILLILLGTTLVLTGFFLFVAIVIFIFGLGGPLIMESHNIFPLFPEYSRLLMGCEMDIVPIQLALLIVFGVPLLMIFYNGLRLILGFERIRNFGMIAFYVWIIGFTVTIFLSLKTYNNLRYSDSKTEVIKPDTICSDTIKICFHGNMDLPDDQFLNFNDDPGLVYGKNDHFYLLPKVIIQKSDKDHYSITKTISSHGRSFSDIRKRLNQIDFKVNLYQDSLFISPYYLIPGKDCWHLERINIRIEVPEGKYISLGEGRWILPGYVEEENLSYIYNKRVRLDSVSTYRMTKNGLEGLDFPY